MPEERGISDTIAEYLSEKAQCARVSTDSASKESNRKAEAGVSVPAMNHRELARHNVQHRAHERECEVTVHCITAGPSTPSNMPDC